MQLRWLNLLLVRDHINLQSAVFFIWADKEIVIKTSRVVLQCFPAPIVVNARPRGYGPAVIQLPIERSHGARATSTQMLCAHLDRLGLHYLAGIEEGLEVPWLAEVAQQIVIDPAIAAFVLLVRQHHR